MTTETIARECRIYVADLAAYNSGRLRGRWIALAGHDSDTLQQEINEILANSPDSNVTRVRCKDCNHIQDYIAEDTCDECGGDLGAPFPSAEEWAVHDHEGFAGLINSEWPDLGELCDAAEILDGSDDGARRGLIWLVADRGYSITDAIAKADDVRTYDGTAEDYAAEFCEDCYSDALKKMPDFLRYHIDWQGVARDLRLGGDIDEATIEGERLIITNASEF